MKNRITDAVNLRLALCILSVLMISVLSNKNVAAQSCPDQLGSQTCWAAAIECVLHYYSAEANGPHSWCAAHYLDQCGIVSYALDDDCCSSSCSFSSSCNQSYPDNVWASDSEDILEHFGVSASDLGRALTANEVAHEIDDVDSPFLMAIEWDSSSGHVMTGTGYNTYTSDGYVYLDNVRVCDPALGVVWYNYAGLVDGSYYPEWIATVKTSDYDNPCSSSQDICSPPGNCYNLDNNDSHCGYCNIDCSSSEECCDGDCISTSSYQTDEDNCGSCGNNCGSNQECCSGSCKSILTDENNCGDCGVTCGSNQQCCGGDCKNILADENNCGDCGVTCGSNQQCCGGDCKDILTDESNCGDCGVTCDSGDECCEGICHISAWFEENNDNCGECDNECDGDTPDCCAWACTNLEIDENNCGTCGVVCGPAQECCEGVCHDPEWFYENPEHCGSCEIECGLGNPDCCGGECTNVDFDVRNCGECYANCPWIVPGTECCLGECKNEFEDYENDPENCGSCRNDCDQSSPGNPDCCDGDCTNLNYDENNCGDCGAVCVDGVAGDRECCNGSCIYEYTYEYDESNCGRCGRQCGPRAPDCCEGGCVNLDFNSLNCGTCGTPCLDSAVFNRDCCYGVCMNENTYLYDENNCGGCGIECSEDDTCCDGTCVDLMWDPYNCGSCGHRCRTSGSILECVWGNCP